jgi:hypothetical protein
MEPTTATQDTSSDLADDILRGADEIAEFLSGTKPAAGRYITLPNAPSWQYSGWAPCCARVDPFF